MNRDSNRAEQIGDLYLLVGENRVFLEITELFLARHRGWNSVHTCANHDEAIGAARGLKPAVVLIDLDMAENNSVGLIQKLRETTPGSAIIALTLLESNAYRQMVLTAGADDYVSKAQLSAELMPRIAEALKARRQG